MSNTTDQFEDASSDLSTKQVEESSPIPVSSKSKRKNKKKKSKKAGGQGATEPQVNDAEDALDSLDSKKSEDDANDDGGIYDSSTSTVAVKESESREGKELSQSEYDSKLSGGPQETIVIEDEETEAEDCEILDEHANDVDYTADIVSTKDDDSLEMKIVQKGESKAADKADGKQKIVMADSNSPPEIAQSPSVPSRKPIDDWLRLGLTGGTSSSVPSELTMRDLEEISSSYNPNSSNFLLQSKYNQLNRRYISKDSKSKESISNGTENVKRTFNEIKSTVGAFSDMLGYKIDWEFWTRVVNDYESVVKNESDELNQLIMKGIPSEIRGIVWQSISRSKNFQMEEFCIQLKSESSIHEKSIRRDLSRTSFYTNVEQVNKGEELFNVIKAYSLFDPDVGYTQGMIFITVPLIMNMNEAECFCLLVTLMKDYRLRELFNPEMKGLHLLLYEFDRLLEKYSPLLYNHLTRQGIKSSMYASQWFLTFFAYKFPFDIVMRIYDIIITSGVEALLKFAVNLMIKNESNLLKLKFDALLKYLKDKLFNIYVNDEYINYPDDSPNLKRNSSVSRRFSLLSSSKKSSNSDEASGSSSYYKLNELVEDSMKVNIEPVDLEKFEYEFECIYSNENSKLAIIDEMKSKNGTLRHDLKGLEIRHLTLNNEHINVVENLVGLKVSVQEIENEIDELNGSVEHLRAEIEQLESKIISSPASAAPEVSTPDLDSKSASLPASIQNNIQDLLEINANETERFANLEEELNELLQEEAALDSKLKGMKNKKWFPRWTK